jgi:hypothetical protein
MSSALAIAGVTAVLRELLVDGLVERNVSGLLGNAVGVSVLAPDRVVPPNAGEPSQINLFLYLVTPNPGWRNERLPSRDASGRLRLANAPLALDLHYLLSAYSGGDLHAEILLGIAMQLLHETPVLSRDAVRRALAPPTDGTPVPPALLALAAAGLERQAELVKLTPRVLDSEEMSKLWTAMQSHFRPTAAYTASVVLIESQQAARSPLPVLSRGPVDLATGRERGIVATPGLLPPLPTLTAALPPARQRAAVIGDLVVLQGHHLDGGAREVVFSNDRLGVDLSIPALPAPSPPSPPGDATQVEVSLEGQAAALPAGVYRVALRVVPPGETEARLSNQVALVLAPRMTNLPLAVALAADGSAAFSIEFEPALHPGQAARLVLGEHEHVPLGDAGSPATSLAFEIADAPPGEHLARLRVDGIDSAIVELPDDPAAAPTFNDQRVSFT